MPRIIEARKVMLDGESVWKFPCPGCGAIGRADADQVAGRVSCRCPRCGWHELIAAHDDFDYYIDAAGKRKQAKT